MSSPFDKLNSIIADDKSREEAERQQQLLEHAKREAARVKADEFRTRFDEVRCSVIVPALRRVEYTLTRAGYKCHVIDRTIGDEGAQPSATFNLEVKAGANLTRSGGLSFVCDTDGECVALHDTTLAGQTFAGQRVALDAITEELVAERAVEFVERLRRKV